MPQELILVIAFAVVVGGTIGILAVVAWLTEPAPIRGTKRSKSALSGGSQPLVKRFLYTTGCYPEPTPFAIPSTSYVCGQRLRPWTLDVQRSGVDQRRVHRNVLLPGVLCPCI